MTRAKKQVSKDPSFRMMKADYYPVQRQTYLNSDQTENDYYVLDVGRNLSVLNHRLYRQGKTYSVKVDLDAGHQTAQYDIYALVDTWYIQKAWQLARATYLKTMVDERAHIGNDKAARWEDFRVDAGLSGSTGQLIPRRFSNGLAGAGDSAGEFFLSQITLPDGTTTRSFQWGTAGANLQILAEYDKVDNTQTNTVASALAYAGVDADTHEVAADALKLRGRNPPYDADNFNTRVWVKIARLDAAAAHGKLSTGYFNAPCGLIAVQPSVTNTAIVGQLSMTVQAGDYKGVKAHNMGA